MNGKPTLRKCLRPPWRLVWPGSASSNYKGGWKNVQLQRLDENYDETWCRQRKALRCEPLSWKAGKGWQRHMAQVRQSPGFNHLQQQLQRILGCVADPSSQLIQDLPRVCGSRIHYLDGSSGGRLWRIRCSRGTSGNRRGHCVFPSNSNQMKSRKEERNLISHFAFCSRGVLDLWSALQ